MNGFDVIGDVHGCCDSLIALLEKLGYQKRGGVYQHAERKVVFLGDLVDRGPKIRETLHLVRAMVQQGHAQMVLGNHEIATIRYLTPGRPGSDREFLREHTERTTFMISETLRQFEQHQTELDEFVQWFYQLPLFIEHEKFRVAHACWDHSHIQAFVARYHKAQIDEEMMHEPLSSMARQTIELLTRGANMSLPGGEAMTSSDGFSRRSFRTKFWHDSPEVYGDLVFQPDPLPEHIHHHPLTDEEREQSIRYAAHERPLFVGHYWCQGEPHPINENIACVDYSAINGGKLVAYRMGQETTLDKANFVWVDACDWVKQ
jgi:Calcineurin-like phosphoesterase